MKIAIEEIVILNFKCGDSIISKSFKMMSSDESPKMEEDKNPENSFVLQGEMDLRDKNALLQCRTRIIKDLDIRIVIDSLLESRVVDENLYEKIKNEVSKKIAKNCNFILTSFWQNSKNHEKKREILFTFN